MSKPPTTTHLQTTVSLAPKVYDRAKDPESIGKDFPAIIRVDHNQITGISRIAVYFSDPAGYGLSPAFEFPLE